MPPRDLRVKEESCYLTAELKAGVEPREKLYRASHGKFAMRGVFIFPPFLPRSERK